MASIPLPALQARTPDNSEGMMRMAQLAQMLKMAPGQQQLQQQAIQQGQQENQMRAQQIADQQAMTKAMQEWDGKDYNSLPGLVLKHGGSAQTVMGLKTSLVKQQQDMENLSKDQLANQATVNDRLLGHIDTIKGVTDPQQRAQVAQSQAQQILQAGLHKNLDPQSAQMIQAVAQGQMVPNDDQLSIFEKGLTGHNGQIEQALKGAETQKNTEQAKQATAQTAKLQAELQFYQKKGLAPGVPLDVQEAQDWLNKNPDKGPADYMAYKAKLVPAFNFNLQAQGVQGGPAPTNPQTGKPLQGEDLYKSFGPQKAGVVKAIIEGRQQPPASFAQKSPYWQDVMAKVYQVDPEFNEQRAQLRKAYTVGPQSKEINAINTSLGHVGVLGDAIDALQNNNVQVLNKIANGIGAQIGATPQTTFKTIVNRVGPELVKAYSGTGGGVEERKAAESDFSPSMSPDQLKSNVGITVRLLRSKISSLENQWDQNKAPGMPSFQEKFIMPEANRAAQKYNPQGGQQPSGGGKEIHYKIVNGQLVAQ